MIIEPIIQGVVARSAHPAGCAAAVAPPPLLSDSAAVVVG